MPRGDVGTVLDKAPCDVAVLVARGGQQVVPEPGDGVLVPFGGAEHDWAALELGAWLASGTGAPLRMLGAAGEGDEPSRVTRLLGDAGLLVQQYAGIPAEPVLAEPGRTGILESAEGAGLLVIGLSERWRQEGLGPTRSEIAKAAPAPTLFVRRGERAGALAPREDVTRFTWSSPGAGAVRSFCRSSPRPEARQGDPKHRRASAGLAERRLALTNPPGASGSSSRPPVSSTRCAHPTRPRPPAASAGSKPRPRSSTSTWTVPFARATSTRTCSAPACFATFVSASCTTR